MCWFVAFHNHNQNCVQLNRPGTLSWGVLDVNMCHVLNFLLCMTTCEDKYVMDRLIIVVVNFTTAIVDLVFAVL